MPKAFKLINTRIGEERKEFQKLSTIPEVKEAHQIYGVYDIIVRLEAITFDELKDEISFQIRQIEDIESTLTLLVT